MPLQDNLVLLAGETYQLVAESQLPSGKRAWQRVKRPSMPSDPGVQKVASWRLGGSPIGLSREDVAGGPLACDYTQNADTLYENLLLPGPARNPIGLSVTQPLSSAPVPYDGVFYDGGAYDGGTSSYGPGRVRFIDEDRGALFFHDAALSTQVDPGAMTAVQTVVRPAAVRGAAMWRNRGYTGLGSNHVMQRRAIVSATGSTYEDVATFYASQMVVGPDRLWMVDPESDNESRLRYSLDALLTRSNAFLVGDPGIPATGLGTYGRSAIAGSEIGAFGFTDLGIPVRVLESLRGQRSEDNAEWIITLWGWTYITTSIGLKATIPGQVENPAGPGADRRYEGPSGRITAIWPYKDALFAAALTADGDAYVYRGEFDDGRYGGSTSATGRPAWFPFAYIPDVEVGVIFSTGLRPTPTLVLGEDGQASYWTLSVLDRDIDDPLYRFHTGASEWNGTTMMRNANTHKTPRTFALNAEDCDASNNYQLSMKVDDGGYVAIGDPLIESGHTVLYPVDGSGVPLTTVNGHFFKPRITGAHASATIPATLRGTLDMVYDERPDTIVHHTFVVELNATRNTPNGAATDFDALSALFSAHGAGAESPLAFQVPGSTTTVYGLVVAVDAVTDLKADGIQKAQVTVQEWLTS